MAVVAIIDPAAFLDGGQVGAAPNDTATDAPLVLDVGIPEGIDDASPIRDDGPARTELINLQYLSLTDLDDASLELVGELAESWTVNENSTSVDYVLRPGISWSDGTPLTADDVAYTIERSRRERWPTHFRFTEFLRADVLDAGTVRVTSETSSSQFPSLPFAIMPQHIFESFPSRIGLAEWDGFPGVGSGPFIVDDVDASGSWTMTSNKTWDGWPVSGPVLAGLSFRVFDTAADGQEMLESGALDVMRGVDPLFFERLDTSIDVEAVAGANGAWVELGLNNGASGLGDRNPALDDVRVRRAIALSIDRPALARDSLDGLALPLAEPLLSKLPQWGDLLRPDQERSVDRDEARELLQRAGYIDRDGDGFVDDPRTGGPLTMRYAALATATYEPRTANRLAEWLAEIGIATEISEYRSTELDALLIAGEFDLVVRDRFAGSDTERISAAFLCSEVTREGLFNRFNPTNYCNSRFDALYFQERAATDPAERRALLESMATILHDDVATIPLFVEFELQAFRVDTYEGWINQPSVVGPVVFNESARTYANLRLLPPSSFSGADLLGVGRDATSAAEPDSASDPPVRSEPVESEPSGRSNQLRLAAIAAAIAALFVAVVWWRRTSRDRGDEPGQNGDDERPPAPLPPPRVAAQGSPLAPPTLDDT